MGWMGERGAMGEEGREAEWGLLAPAGGERGEVGVGIFALSRDSARRFGELLLLLPPLLLLPLFAESLLFELLLLLLLPVKGEVLGEVEFSLFAL